MMRRYTMIAIVFLLFTGRLAYGQQSDMLKLVRSEVRFSSNAPLEIIKAGTTEMTGLIKATSGTFAFRIPMRSFKGFNSPLQMEHFHENYMESDKYKTSSFQGRIIEDVDFLIGDTLDVRAKGILNMHGVEQERIIPSRIIISEKGIVLSAEFLVLLAEHNISIPKIVEQKIAREILVNLEATFIWQDAP